MNIVTVAVMGDASKAADKAATTPGEPQLSNEDIYDILSDTRRRYALHYLKQCDEPVDVRTLAEQIAAWENDKPVADLSSQERKRVYISLYQSHLSTLDEQGIVEYDEDAGVVTLSEEFRDVDIYLEVVPEQSIPWSYYYVGLSLAGFLTVMLAYFDILLFAQVPELGLAIAILSVFTGSALVQTYQQQRTHLGDEGPPPSIQD